LCWICRGAWLQKLPLRDARAEESKRSERRKRTPAAAEAWEFEKEKQQAAGLVDGMLSASCALRRGRCSREIMCGTED